MAVPVWFTEVLDRELRPWLTLSEDQIFSLYTHYSLLERWNEKISLTSVEPGPELVIRHYCESLFLASHLGSEPGERVADLGSGAGFPGVPLAVYHPQCHVFLIESVQRKAVFLREATRHLPNIEVLGGRAEDVQSAFDWIVSRAVNPGDVLKNIPSLAPKVGLLLSERGLGQIKSRQGIAWSEPVRLPWGDRKFFVIGSTWNNSL